MPENILEPREAWDVAEEEIDLWQEAKDRKARAFWRALNGY